MTWLIQRKIYEKGKAVCFSLLSGCLSVFVNCWILIGKKLCNEFVKIVIDITGGDGPSPQEFGE